MGTKNFMFEIEQGEWNEVVQHIKRGGSRCCTAKIVPSCCSSLIVSPIFAMKKIRKKREARRNKCLFALLYAKSNEKASGNKSWKA